MEALDWTCQSPRSLVWSRHPNAGRKACILRFLRFIDGGMARGSRRAVGATPEGSHSVEWSQNPAKDAPPHRRIQPLDWMGQCRQKHTCAATRTSILHGWGQRHPWMASAHPWTRQRFKPGCQCDFGSRRRADRCAIRMEDCARWAVATCMFHRCRECLASR